MSAGKKMTRQEAEALYADLRKSMAGKIPASMLGSDKPRSASEKKADAKVAAEIAKSIKAALSSEPTGTGTPTAATSAPRALRSSPEARPNRGMAAAILMVLLAAGFKISLSALELSGAMQPQMAQAMIQQGPRNLSGYSREEMQILTALDARRVELEERKQKLEDRGRVLDQRDADFAVKLSELRELSERLKNDREKDEKKKSGQYEQLSNVYGSMNPEEASKLIEQLDVTIALELLSRMPEKRIGQILAMMSPDKALALTKMLSAVK